MADGLSTFGGVLDDPIGFAAPLAAGIAPIAAAASGNTAGAQQATRNLFGGLSTLSLFQQRDFQRQQAEALQQIREQNARVALTDRFTRAAALLAEQSNVQGLQLLRERVSALGLDASLIDPFLDQAIFQLPRNLIRGRMEHLMLQALPGGGVPGAQGQAPGTPQEGAQAPPGGPIGGVPGLTFGMTAEGAVTGQFDPAAALLERAMRELNVTREALSSRLRGRLPEKDIDRLAFSIVQSRQEFQGIAFPRGVIERGTAQPTELELERLAFGQDPEAFFESKRNFDLKTLLEQERIRHSSRQAFEAQPSIDTLNQIRIDTERVFETIEQSDFPIAARFWPFSDVAQALGQYYAQIEVNLPRFAKLAGDTANIAIPEGLRQKGRFPTWWEMTFLPKQANAKIDALERLVNTFIGRAKKVIPELEEITFPRVPEDQAEERRKMGLELRKQTPDLSESIRRAMKQTQPQPQAIQPLPEPPTVTTPPPSTAPAPSPSTQPAPSPPTRTIPSPRTQAIPQPRTRSIPQPATRTIPQPQQLDVERIEPQPIVEQSQEDSPDARRTRALAQLERLTPNQQRQLQRIQETARTQGGRATSSAAARAVADAFRDRLVRFFTQTVTNGDRHQAEQLVVDIFSDRPSRQDLELVR